jgi:hypothetical protein
LYALIKQAAAIREAGKPWEEVARRCNRKVTTVDQWPWQYPDLWHEHTATARDEREAKLSGRLDKFTELLVDGGIEAVIELRAMAKGYQLPEAEPDPEEVRGKPLSLHLREAAAHSLVSNANKIRSEHRRATIGDRRRPFAELPEETQNQIIAEAERAQEILRRRGEAGPLRVVEGGASG